MDHATGGSIAPINVWIIVKERLYREGDSKVFECDVAWHAAEALRLRKAWDCSKHEMSDCILVLLILTARLNTSKAICVHIPVVPKSWLFNAICTLSYLYHSLLVSGSGRQSIGWMEH